MKKLAVVPYNFMLLFAFLFLYSTESFGQEKVNITAGFGTIDLLNLGLQFQVKQSQLGFSIGTLPSKQGGFSLSSGYSYHFGGYSDLSTLRPWYGKSGLVYLKSKTEDFTDSYLFLDMRIGKDFNFSKKMGITINAGPAIQLIHTTTDIEGGWSFPIFPAMGLGFFYRL